MHPTRKEIKEQTRRMIIYKVWAKFEAVKVIGRHCIHWLIKQRIGDTIDTIGQLSRSYSILIIKYFTSWKFMLVIPVPRRLRQKDCHKFEAGLSYIVSSRSASYSIKVQSQT